jgi:hypothetical protein
MVDLITAEGMLTMADDLSMALMARIEQLEANQARILTTLSAIHAALGQLISLGDQAPEPPSTAPVASVPDELDQGALIDLVWDSFDMNADAYGFWHSAHPELKDRAPFEIAGTREGDLAIRKLLAARRGA